MKYLMMHDCRVVVFSYIQRSLTKDEPASEYDRETTGMAEIEKILNFVRNDDYYPNFENKCAYMLCSIAGSQHFSNGNKRLSIALLMHFLAVNDVTVVNMSAHELKTVLQLSFPNCA